MVLNIDELQLTHHDTVCRTAHVSRVEKQIRAKFLSENRLKPEAEMDKKYDLQSKFRESLPRDVTVWKSTQLDAQSYCPVPSWKPNDICHVRSPFCIPWDLVTLSIAITVGEPIARVCRSLGRDDV
jgi:hypothetical protein